MDLSSAEQNLDLPKLSEQVSDVLLLRTGRQGEQPWTVPGGGGRGRVTYQLSWPSSNWAGLGILQRYSVEGLIPELSDCGFPGLCTTWQGEISAAALAFLGLPDTRFGPHVLPESRCIHSSFLRAGAGGRQECRCAVSPTALALQRAPAPTPATVRQQGSRQVQRE